MQYIVIDLEWNGSYSKKAHGYFNEIIEVGAVKVNEDMKIVVRQKSEKLIADAKNGLAVIPDSESKNLILEMVDFFISRNY